jgi:nucleotide-binding universal stress UspA family protein
MASLVVGYDGSEGARAALGAAIELAGGLGDRVVAVFGFAPPGIWGGDLGGHERAIEEHGERIMDEAKAQASDAGVEIEVMLVAKRGTEALVDLAAERDARAIVVGSYGDPPLRGAILGTIPNKLLHLAERPVLVVPAGG